MFRHVAMHESKKNQESSQWYTSIRRFNMYCQVTKQKSLTKKEKNIKKDNENPNYPKARNDAKTFFSRKESKQQSRADLISQ
jgi:hypothetical protein